MPLIDLQQHVEMMPDVFGYIGGLAEFKFAEPDEEAEIRE